MAWGLISPISNHLPGSGRQSKESLMRKSFSLGLAAGVLGIGLSAIPAKADVKLNDQLSLSGFIDMSTYYNTQVFTFPGFTGTSNEPGATFDQFELDFMYKFSDKLSARVDLNS